MRPQGNSNGSRRGTVPFGLGLGLGLGRRGSPARPRVLYQGVSLAALSIAAGTIGACGVMSSARAQTLDLGGVNVALPDGAFFGSKGFLNGTDNVTNNGGAAATLFEGGGPTGTTYPGTSLTERAQPAGFILAVI